jgi:NAD-dependent dihydropyrimidine dehydrogenase PreA subunit
MAYVITDNCVKDELCVDVCPPDCIHPKKDEAQFETATQLYVDPDGCIDCGACVPACTSDSIFVADELPEDKKSFLQRTPPVTATCRPSCRDGLALSPIALKPSTHEDAASRVSTEASFGGPELADSRSNT